MTSSCRSRIYTDRTGVWRVRNQDIWYISKFEWGFVRNYSFVSTISNSTVCLELPLSENSYNDFACREVVNVTLKIASETNHSMQSVSSSTRFYITKPRWLVLWDILWQITCNYNCFERGHCNGIDHHKMTALGMTWWQPTKIHESCVRFSKGSDYFSPLETHWK